MSTAVGGGAKTASPFLRSSDLFLLYYQRLKRFGHVGFVVEVGDDEFGTLEGNTGPRGSREGYGVFKRSRRIGKNIAFVHWIAAE